MNSVATNESTNTTTFGLSKDLSIPIIVKICYMPTNNSNKLITASTKFENPRVFARLSKIYKNSDLFIKICVYDGKNNNLISVPVQTSYKSFNNNKRMWNEYLKLSITYNQISIDSYLKFLVYEIVDTKEQIFAIGYLSLFNTETSTLRKGSQKIQLFVNEGKKLGNLKGLENGDIKNGDLKNGDIKKGDIEKVDLEELTNKHKKNGVHKRVLEGTNSNEDYDNISPHIHYTSIPGLTEFEKNLISYENGEYKRINWLDKMVLQNINLSDSSSPYYLYIELPNFNLPIIYSDISYSIPTNLIKSSPTPEVNELSSNLIINSIDIPSSNSKVYDFDFQTLMFKTVQNSNDSDPIEQKYHKLGRNLNKISILDKELKPTPQLRDELLKILSKPSNIELNDNEKNLIWKFRYFFSKNNFINDPSNNLTKSFLPKFLKSINWENESELNHVFNEIIPNYWSVDKLQIGDALELLSDYFNPYNLIPGILIEKGARTSGGRGAKGAPGSGATTGPGSGTTSGPGSGTTSGMTTGTTSGVIPSEMYSGEITSNSPSNQYSTNESTFKYSNASFISSKYSKNDETKFIKVFQYIAFIRKFAVERLKLANSDELLLYLLQLVQALKYESLIFNKSFLNNFDEFQIISELNNDENVLNSPLAKFLIEKSVENEKLGNFFYWYVKVENEDQISTSSSSIYSIILNKYIEKLKKHSSKNYKNLKKQIWFIKKLTNLVELIRSSFKKNEATGKKVEFLREYLANSSNELLKFPEPFPLPLDPNVIICGCYPQESSVFKSSLSPLKITFKTVEKGSPKGLKFNGPKHGKYPLMFKIGDDLRQDQLVIQIINLMDQLLKNENLNLKLTPYKILATSPIAGLIQFVENDTLDSILSRSYPDMPANFNGIIKYLKIHSKDPIEPESSEMNLIQSQITPKHIISSDLGVSSILMDNYVKSCAGYCVITYLLGVGDRHLDNLLLSPNGKFWHADFGYILGRDPKPFPPLMKLPIQVIDGMGGLNHENFDIFKSYCFITYTTLRKNSNLILNLFQLMLDANIPDIKIDPNRAIDKVQEKFCLEMSEEEAILHFQNLINDSVSAFLPVVIDRLHSLAQYWRA